MDHSAAKTVCHVMGEPAGAQKDRDDPVNLGLAGSDSHTDIHLGSNMAGFNIVKLTQCKRTGKVP